MGQRIGDAELNVNLRAQLGPCTRVERDSTVNEALHVKQSAHAQHLVNKHHYCNGSCLVGRLTELVGGYPVNSIAVAIIWLSVNQIRSLKIL